MQPANKIVKKVIKNAKKAKFKGCKKTPIKSNPKSNPKEAKIKIKSSKGAVLGKNNIPEELGTTAAIAPEDYEHIYNVERAKLDPQYMGKVKQNIAVGVGLGAAAIKEAPENIPNKATVPDDCEQLQNAKKDIINEVNIDKVPAKASALPNKEPVKNAPQFNPNEKVATIAIAPTDYVQIFNAKNGPKGPIPNQLELKKAVNDNVENKKAN